MSMVLGLIMVALATGFVAWPFFWGEASAEPSGAAGARLAARQGDLNREKLEQQKHEAYAAIKEAEFDFRMGKLSQEDFDSLRDKYSAQALQAIAALEQGAAQLRQRRPTRIAFCPACGHSVPPRAKYCPGCGCGLKEAVA